MDLKTPLKLLPGVGSYYSFKLLSLGLKTVEDLIYYFPFRYDDFSNVSSASDAQIGEHVTLKGEIWSIKDIYTRSRKVLTQALFNDGTTVVELTWFNSPWLTKSIKSGDRLQISGKLGKYKNKLSIMAPQWEKLAIINDQLAINNSLHTGRLVPIYSETEGLSSKWLRTKFAQVLPNVLEQIIDPLPVEIRGEMLDLKTALQNIHFPESFEDVKKARERLSFDELFFIQLNTQKVRLEWQKRPLISPFLINNEAIKQFNNSLPFSLTNAQLKVLEEIIQDLQGTTPMNRLVQGEVGSGKTIVAAICAYIAHLNKLGTFYMAPTEILAFQHHTTLKKFLEPHGIEVGIYTGSRKSTMNNERRIMKDGGSSANHLSSFISHHSTPSVVVGTHALLSEKLSMDNVGLVIVDEQQRFGVAQRATLRSKAKVPHFLTMTATPIPRTVALTLFGDLDVSVINELPKGRKAIKTHVVPNKKRGDAYKFIEKKIIEGDQVYIITPLIEESESIKSAKAATSEFEMLQNEIFPDFKLGLLHGRLKPKEKEQVLNDFKDHKIDILVSTSVVEVGVDVPNATIMVIESAERFGLAGLHQLRGRVGRGEKESFCLLFTSQSGIEAYKRLKNLEHISDGLKLAEIDLEIRGSGEVFGTAQSGQTELKIASLTDIETIEKARNAAKLIIEKDPTLESYPLLKEKLKSQEDMVMPD